MHDWWSVWLFFCTFCPSHQSWLTKFLQVCTINLNLHLKLSFCWKGVFLGSNSGFLSTPRDHFVWKCSDMNKAEGALAAWSEPVPSVLLTARHHLHFFFLACHRWQTKKKLWQFLRSRLIFIMDQYIPDFCCWKETDKNNCGGVLATPTILMTLDFVFEICEYGFMWWRSGVGSLTVSRSVSCAILDIRSQDSAASKAQRSLIALPPAGHHLCRSSAPKSWTAQPSGQHLHSRHCLSSVCVCV